MIALLLTRVLVFGVLQLVIHRVVEEINDKLQDLLYGTHFTLEFPFLFACQIKLIKHEPLD